MNRYPLWKYLMVLMALLISLIYTLPNIYGESPAVQISSAKVTLKVDEQLLGRVENILQQNNIEYSGAFFQQNGPLGNIRIRFLDTDTQLKAKDIIERSLNNDPEEPNYTIALNLLSSSPNWLTSLGANPMYLGLDLRGGVHFLLQVDMKGALDTRYDSLVTELRTNLRNEKHPFESINKVGSSIQIYFSNETQRDNAEFYLRQRNPELTFKADANRPMIAGIISPLEIKRVEDSALKQNILTLHNRINELGVAEPIIQQQGQDRIVVQLPGIQDVAKAKELLGRTATLQIRLVDESPTALAALREGTVPFGLERFTDTNGQPLLVLRQITLTGENLENAVSGRDHNTQQPTVNLTLDGKGARIFRDVTRESIGKRMAIILFENGKGQVVTAPYIRSEIPGGQVQISGSMTSQQASDVALLLRAGSLAAPMSIIEERTIGPSLGAENIKQGFNSTLYGFIAIAVFIIAYYMLFGIFSTLGLMFNILLLLALLSIMQATLTLPGIAALALALGMAIDSNVLINERIREELRNGAKPQQAIAIGFDKAWATIIDSNLTTLVVGLALLAFGSGPVRGFAVVHSLGILTSMFSSVVGVRALSNLWYGHRKRLKSISIGTIWKPEDKKK